MLASGHNTAVAGINVSQAKLQHGWDRGFLRPHVHQRSVRQLMAAETGESLSF